MNPAYTLARKFGIPVIVKPEWDECQKLREDGLKLLEEGQKRWDAGLDLYMEAVTRELGPKYVDRIDWETGEVK